jgi:hypothetical protein
MDGSYNMRAYNLTIFLITMIAVNMLTICHAKSIHDLIKPTKNTLDWLDSLEVLDTLENTASSPEPSDTQNLISASLASESSHWLKQKTKNFRALTRLQITDQLSVRPAKVKSKPYDSSGSQKAYGLKFKYEF